MRVTLPSSGGPFIHQPQAANSSPPSPSVPPWKPRYRLSLSLGPGPPPILSSLSYQLRGQLPSVREEGARQEHSAVQLSPRVWGSPRGARRWPWGSSSLWPQAQRDQDQAANTCGREAAEGSGGTFGRRDEGWGSRILGRSAQGRLLARAGFPLPLRLWLPRPSEQTRPRAGRRAGRLPSAPGRRNLGPGAGREGEAQARTCPLPGPREPLAGLRAGEGARA